MGGDEFSALTFSPGIEPDPEEFITQAMEWHFSEQTGSPFWLERAKTLPFNPLTDVRSFGDLSLFPNVTDELRGVSIRDLIPRGFGPKPEVVAVIESGGTTGQPKRIPLLREFADRLTAATVSDFQKLGIPKGDNWLLLMPSGPHGGYEQAKRVAAEYGSLVFGIDMDPRWVKKLIADGKKDEANAYGEHLVDQAAFVLRSQDVGLVRCTPPVLARIARRDDLVDAIRSKLHHLRWGGASMDLDTRYLYRTEIFPHVPLSGGYGTTMALGAGANERPGLSLDDHCIFDASMPPLVTFSVVDPSTQTPVKFGERGQLVVHHVSQSFLLPNNLERDMATRIEPPPGQIGDSVADISPVVEFGGTSVIEGVY